MSPSLPLHISLLKTMLRDDVYARIKDITVEWPKYRKFATLQLARAHYQEKLDLGEVKAIPNVGSIFYPVNIPSPSPSPPSSPSSVGDDELWDQLSDDGLWDQLSRRMDRASLG